jgi:hypothetical protein
MLLCCFWWIRKGLNSKALDDLNWTPAVCDLRLKPFQLTWSTAGMTDWIVVKRELNKLPLQRPTSQIHVQKRNHGRKLLWGMDEHGAACKWHIMAQLLATCLSPQLRRLPELKQHLTMGYPSSAFTPGLGHASASHEMQSILRRWEWQVRLAKSVHSWHGQTE